MNFLKLRKINLFSIAYVFFMVLLLDYLKDLYLCDIKIIFFVKFFLLFSEYKCNDHVSLISLKGIVLWS